MHLSPASRWVISATLVMASAMGIGRFAYTPLLPEMVAQYNWSFATAGDLASANFIGYLVGALLAPAITQSPYIRIWLAASLMASAVTTYLGAEANSFNLWLAVRFLSGVASAFCLVAVTTHLMFVLAKERQEKFGNVHFAGVGLGILICMLAVYGGGDVSTQWARLGALSAGLMAVAWFLIGKHQFQPIPVVSRQRFDSGFDWTLWRLIIGYGFFGFGYVVAATFVVAMAQRLDTPGVDVRSVWTVVGLAFVPSVYLWQWVANRFGLLNTLTLAYLVEAVGVVRAGLSGSYVGLLLACVLLGATFGAITALGLSAARTAAPNRVAFAVSSMTVAFSLGQLIGPAVSGRMADASGDFVMASLLAAVLLVAAAGLVRPGKAAVT